MLAVTVGAWSAQALVAPTGAPGVDPPSRLIEATVRRFGREFGDRRVAAAAIRWRSSIPRKVGLGGSSALVIATTRALLAHCGRSLTPNQLAEFALKVETEELGIVAGLQDRLAQAFEGLTYMDFSKPSPRCESLDPALLPPLLIAWRQEAGVCSSQVHSSACRSADRDVVAGLAEAARQARDALRSGDRASFAASLDRTLDLRARLMELDAPTLEMARAGRSCQAAVNYTGSGGAIVAAAPGDRLQAAATQLQELGCGVLLTGSG